MFQTIPLNLSVINKKIIFRRLLMESSLIMRRLEFQCLLRKRAAHITDYGW